MTIIFLKMIVFYSTCFRLNKYFGTRFLEVSLILTNHFSARHCSAGDKLTFARVSGFESAARPGPILLTAPADGMTKECILRCEQRDDCRSFSIDYRRHECYIATYFSGTLPAHLRPSPGKTYFEGICVPGNPICFICLAMK